MNKPIVLIGDNADVAGLSLAGVRAYRCGSRAEAEDVIRHGAADAMLILSASLAPLVKDLIEEDRAVVVLPPHEG